MKTIVPEQRISALVDRLKITWKGGVDDTFVVDGVEWPRDAVADLLRVESEDNLGVQSISGQRLSDLECALLWIRRYRVDEAIFPFDLSKGCRVRPEGGGIVFGDWNGAVRLEALKALALALTQLGNVAQQNEALMRCHRILANDSPDGEGDLNDPFLGR